MTKKISILIPAYNEEEVLDMLYERLDKLATDNDAYNFEFLFVNDGSRDATLAILKAYAANDSQIGIHRTEICRQL